MHVMFSYLYKEPLAIYRQAEQSSIVSTNNGPCFCLYVSIVLARTCVQLLTNTQAVAKHRHGLHWYRLSTVQSYLYLYSVVVFANYQANYLYLYCM